MGFKCQKCNKASLPDEKQRKLLVEKRERTYHYYVVKIRNLYGEDKEIITEIKPKDDEKDKKILKEFIKKGWEIVKELKVCKQCAEVKNV